jgi:FHA domain
VKITGAVAGPPAASTAPSPPAGPARACPSCGTPGAGAARFCEDCGYDYSTGKVPVPAAPVAAPAGAPWTATVTADRAYFDANDLDGVEFPAQYPERTFTLVGPQVRIGRSSTSKGLHPEVDLSAAPLDPGVSHSHALLTRNQAGVWLLSDLGSTNGTYLNGGTEPLAVGQLVSLTDGDRVHVGAWTTITVHAPA